MLNRYMDSLENIEERLKQIEKKVIEDLGELAIEVLILRETKKGIWFEDIRRQELMQKHNEKFK